jgi:hypothetical protein
MRFGRKKVTYLLENYPAIRDFATMMERLEPGNHWNGSEFFGETIDLGAESERLGFCHRENGIKIWLTPEEWQVLKSLVSSALSLDAIQPLLSELSVAYGEI